MSAFDIQISDQQQTLKLDCAAICRAVQEVLDGANLSRATISVAVVDNEQIHALNRTHLQHDYATDVLSFVFESNEECVDGEIVVSAEMAAHVAEELGIVADDELLLYVVHGALHLVGCDDKDEEARAEMLAKEAATLATLGLTTPAHRSTPVGTPVSEGDSS